MDGGNDNLPINCVTWYEAEAFCIWYGGRLPTEAEWNYAAAGGAEQRHYPWTNPPASQTIDRGYAVYNGVFAASVGSRATIGDGKYGQADLAGNVWDWVQDSFGPYPSSCNNCASLGSSPAGVIRGGAFDTDAGGVLTSSRIANDPSSRDFTIGARCARAR